ncbi:hypothetical protein LENED_009200 [Lentinula edodes]|uniref:Uncharacterized protein n=1 Tax=Lentinula edodes TaxID=5353 RepID=A0A1Q3EJ54_LENED|nr:hypothetical protein LENED_009200 [Lentinula edodes]
MIVFSRASYCLIDSRSQQNQTGMAEMTGTMYLDHTQPLVTRFRISSQPILILILLQYGSHLLFGGMPSWNMATGCT